MKNLVASILLFFSFNISAQNILIEPDGIAPNETKSFKVMTYQEILDIPNPRIGDVRYDKTFKRIRVFDGNMWTSSDNTPDAKLVEFERYNLLGMVNGDNNEVYLAFNLVSEDTLGTHIIAPTSSAGNIALAKYNFITYEYLWAEVLLSASSMHVNMALSDAQTLIVVSQDKVLSYDLNAKSANWTKSVTGGIVERVKVDPDGEIVFLGRFRSSVGIGALTKSNSYSLGYGAFISSLASTGQENWIKTLTSPLQLGRYAFDLSDKVNGEKNILMGLTFSQEVNWEGSVVTSSGGSDILVASVFNGNFGITTSHSKVGSLGNEIVRSLSFAPQSIGAYSLAGTFDGSTNLGFDIYQLSDVLLTAQEGTDGFVSLRSYFGSVSSNSIITSSHLKGVDNEIISHIKCTQGLYPHSIYGIGYAGASSALQRVDTGNSLGGFSGLTYSIPSNNGGINPFIVKLTKSASQGSQLLTSTQYIHGFIVTDSFILISSNGGLEVRAKF